MPKSRAEFFLGRSGGGDSLPKNHQRNSSPPPVCGRTATGRGKPLRFATHNEGNEGNKIVGFIILFVLLVVVCGTRLALENEDSRGAAAFKEFFE